MLTLAVVDAARLTDSSVRLSCVYTRSCGSNPRTLLGSSFDQLQQLLN